MTTTYDSQHEAYTDESDVRLEIARVQDVCHGCRRCTDLCSVFPTLFEMLDHMAEPSAGVMTPAQQDRVVSECVHCTLCAVGCPHGSGNGDVDVPRLMLRARAMQFENDHLDRTDKTASRVLARPDRIGRIASVAPGLANRVAGFPAGTRRRRLLARLTGVSAQRDLGTFATERFTSWFRERPRIKLRRRQAAVTLFPTCFVEYQATAVGKDLVKVYERNGIECAVSSARCCGAPLLHAGDIGAFRKVAEKNMRLLAAEIRAGTDVVAPEPACAHVLTVDSSEHVVSEQAKADAALVVEHTYDSAEYLMTLHRSGDFVLDTDFDGVTHRRITYLASSHVRARKIGFPSRDLMRLTGAQIQVVPEEVGTGGIWSMRAHRDVPVEPLHPAAGDPSGGGGRGGSADDGRAGDVVVSDSHLAGRALISENATIPLHPVQIIAQAYGISDGR